MDDRSSPANKEIRERQEVLYDRALNQSNQGLRLIYFGQYLHFLEDKWSHWGYRDFSGHAEQTFWSYIFPGVESPDTTHARPHNYHAGSS